MTIGPGGRGVPKRAGVYLDHVCAIGLRGRPPPARCEGGSVFSVRRCTLGPGVFVRLLHTLADGRSLGPQSSLGCPPKGELLWGGQGITLSHRRVLKCVLAQGVAVLGRLFLKWSPVSPHVLKVVIDLHIFTLPSQVFGVAIRVTF